MNGSVGEVNGEIQKDLSGNITAAIKIRKVPDTTINAGSPTYYF